MIVVSDTSPINYLVLLTAIDVLPQLFQRVFIPPAVLTELQRQATPSQVREWASQLPDWVEIRAPAAVDLSLKLDPGEIEAIALASEVLDSTLLVDERRAARAARKRGIRSIGTLALLADAAAAELLDLRDSLEKLRNTNFRAPQELIAELLRADNERRNSK